MAKKFQKTKRIFSVLLAMVMLLAVLPMPSAQAAIDRRNVSYYRSGDTYTAPVKEGLVFSGWYTDAKLTKPLPVTTKTGLAYAKYVDENVLGVKWQIKADTTADSAKTDLRLLTSVDALTYKEVGFIVEADGKPVKELTSNTVYRTVYGYVNDGNEAYQPTIFSEQSKYFMVHTLTNIPQSDFDSKIKVTPKWITLDGTVILGAPLTFKISDAFPEKPYEGLPRLDFNGDIANMESKDDLRNVEVTYVSGDVCFEGFAELKIQGSSSAAYPKKNYTMKLYKDAAHDKKLKVDVGWGEESKYCLKANYVDKTHCRNLVTANLAADANEMFGLFQGTPNNGAVDGFPIEIYNNGEFLGLYTFNIPKDEWLFNMDGDDPNNIAIQSEIASGNTIFADRSNEGWEVEAGPDNAETWSKFDRLAEFVMYTDDAYFKEHLDEYLDLEATLHNIIFIELAYMRDSIYKNVLLITYDGQKWYPFLYDLDTTWGADWHGQSLQPYENQGMRMLLANDNALFRRVKENFTKELTDRYFALRKTVLSNQNIMDEFRAFKAQIPQESFDREKERWGADLRGFDLDQIQHYLNVYVPRVDAYYEELSRNAN